MSQFTSRLALFACAVFALTLLVYAGRTYSIDEQSVLATADSLARFGRADTNLLAFTHWDLPPPSGLGRFNAAGDYFSKKAPGMALLAAPLFWLGLRLPWLGGPQAALLAAPLLTAFSAAVVFALGLRLGFGRGAALFAGGALALASPALVYSRTLFTEPLALAGVALALYGAHRGRAALCGLGAALAVAGNTVYLALAPVLALFVVLATDPNSRNPLSHPLAAFQGGGARKRVSLALLRFALPLAAWLAVLAAFNALRFGSPLQSGYHFDSGEGFTTPLWVGVYGLLFSPARGLLWFFPLALLAIPGWFILRRRAPALAWLALAVFVWHVVVFGLWWSWAGGVSWGPRFLLPALPAVALCLLPVAQAAFSARRLWLAGLAALALLSAGVQVVGAAVDINRVEAELSTRSPWSEAAPPGFNHGWDALSNPALSPIVIGMQQLRAAPPEIAWLRSVSPDWLSLLLLLSVAGVGGWLLRDSLLAASPNNVTLSEPLLGERRVPRHNDNSFGVMRAAALCLLAALAANLALARLPRPLLGLYGPLADLPAALAGAMPGDVLVSLTPDLTGPLLAVGRRPPTYGLPRTAGPDDDLAARAFAQAQSQARRMWLLTYDPPPDDWYTAQLAASSDLIYAEVLDGYRLRVFDKNEAE